MNQAVGASSGAGNSGGNASGLDALRAVLQRASRQRRLALGVAWGCALLGTLSVPLVPERFEAKALVYVDTQSVLKPLTAGLAFQPDIDEQVRMLARTVVSRQNIDWLLDQKDLGLTLGMDTSSPARREAAAGRLMKNIKLTVGESGLYTIAYRDTEAERARRVVERMLQLFVDSSSRDKRRDSADASRFIGESITTAEQELRDAQGRLDAFKREHFAVNGAPRQDHFALIGSLQDEIAKLRQDLLAAEQARDIYARELAAEVPARRADGSVDDADGGRSATAMTPLDLDVQRQREQLDGLLTRYTERHPQVRRAQQRLDELQARQRAQAEAEAAHPAARRATAGPVAQQLRVAMTESQAQVASLRSRMQVQQARLDAAQAAAAGAPSIDAELQRLQREVDTLHANRDQLQARQEAATLGLRMDESARLAQFRVIEPPVTPGSPVFPGRPALAALEVALSLLAGLLAPTALAALRPTVDDVRSLRALAGRPVAAALSAAPGRRLRAAQRQRRWREAGALAGLLALQCGWLAWVALPTLR